ncbi:MAG: hypothetical protein AYK19_15760 [Theionarchaea archaeon DG-70-1]|nr:MAG: hypothetical protein AYK19_15760 [Theionarchaea archaeon DG-70-1]
MRTTLEQRKKQFRVLYEVLNETPRIFVKDVSSILCTNRYVTAKRMQEAFNSGYILIPQIRKRSYANLKEYMIFLRCTKSMKKYLKYVEDTNVIYHAKMLGYFNLWVTSKEKIDIQGDVIAEGFRSDYYVAYAPGHSWQKSVETIREKIDTFNPDDYTPKGYIKTHWNEAAEWDSEFELLYREFKYNLRKKETPLRKKYLISGGKMQKWYQLYSQYCTVFTRYFPDGFSAYDPYLFVFETDYEDFIIDLFSELPSSPMFLRVSDKLFLYANVPRHFMRDISVFKGVSRLHIPLLIEELLEKEIIKNEDEQYSMIEYSTGKNL